MRLFFFEGDSKADKEIRRKREIKFNDNPTLCTKGSAQATVESWLNHISMLVLLCRHVRRCWHLSGAAGGFACLSFQFLNSLNICATRWYILRARSQCATFGSYGILFLLTCLIKNDISSSDLQHIHLKAQVKSSPKKALRARTNSRKLCMNMNNFLDVKYWESKKQLSKKKRVCSARVKVMQSAQISINIREI